MFVRLYRQEEIRSCGLLCAFGAVAAVLLWLPQAAATGISRGLSVCANVIIPTLYPFMILAGLLTDSPVCRRPGRLAEALTRCIFHLPGCAAPVILISLVGGYPAGALAISRLCRQNRLTSEQAHRMTLFCVNGGPGFIVTTVGSGLLGSTAAGLLLFAAHAVTSLTFGILLGIRHRRDPITAEAVIPDKSGRGLSETVSDTVAALLSMCGFVVLAAAVLSITDAIGLPGAVARLCHVRAADVSGALAAVLEVSCGCIALAGTGGGDLFRLCLCMSWGGLSVQGQLATLLKGYVSLDSVFTLFRLLHGIVSGCLALLLFRLIPVRFPSVGVWAPAGGRPALSSSVQASAALLGLTFFAMLCFYPKKTGNSTQGVL